MHLYVGLPEAADRAEIIRIQLRRAAVANTNALDGLVEEIVPKTVAFSGADLAFVCQAAKLHALQRGGFAAEVALAAGDFEAALTDFSTQHSTLA